ncbi:putative endo-1,3(4)-beta-glucanase [Rosa chinensis]|uniref:Putative endo-1,3(4)-beta-glucanase n=1 Tax=Rosa chinensis TaxID=74649 RepID=A0A2P6RGG4_ROSCH|nr:putative endo-1,3(4)-beta-glucanase [Rosa chinensis]
MTMHVAILEGVKYRNIDGELVGVVGDSWVLRPEPVSVTCHSIKGVKEESKSEIMAALCQDVEGKLVARAARLALIAEEVGYVDVILAIEKYLRDAIEPWFWMGLLVGMGFCMRVNGVALLLNKDHWILVQMSGLEFTIESTRMAGGGEGGL